ncbi:MAG: hypothetical protein U0573_13575 [Phycisphaerales bacterium]|nr:hypothetical protein [Planctomycetota bacterium]
MRTTLLSLATAAGLATVSPAAPTFFPTGTPTGHWYVCTNIDRSGEGKFESFKTDNFVQSVNINYDGSRLDWIADIPGGTHGGVGNWTFFVFRQTFDLTGYDPATANLTIRWGADDSGEIFADRGSWIPAYTLNGGPFIYYPGSSPEHRIPTYSYSQWTSITTGFVSGINTIDFYVEGNGQTDGFGLQVQSFTASPACPCDLNHDGQVDDADFSIFVVAYNMLDCADPSMPANCPSDFNHDGAVDDADFIPFVAAYNELLCP